MWSQASETEVSYAARKMQMQKLLYGNHCMAATSTAWYKTATVDALPAHQVIGTKPHTGNWHKQTNRNMQFLGQAFLWNLPGALHKGAASIDTRHSRCKVLCCSWRASFLVCYGFTLSGPAVGNTETEDLIFTLHEQNSCCYSWEELHAEIRRLNENVWIRSL